MKVLYTWLHDFVAVSASPEELSSRLALSGTNIGGIENGPHGAVIDAEVTSNRPDCLSHYGIAREVGGIYKLPLKHVSPKPSESGAKAAEAIKVEIRSPELCGRFTARNPRRKNSTFSSVAQKQARSLRRCQHQQHRRRLQLRHAGAWPRAAHLRLRQNTRPHYRCARHESRASSAPNATGGKLKLWMASSANSIPASV